MRFDDDLMMTINCCDYDHYDDNNNNFFKI